MTDQPLISVIVPVYKVEQYLDRCIESIVNQTYRNLEIILVDDGSPDNCPAMCDAWAKKDSRIRVIHKANGGLSDARNAGMAIATGELIGFVDSDDWIAPEMYQLLYENMRQNDSDISACGVQMVWEDGTEPKVLTKSGSCVLNAEDAMRASIEESWLKQPVWYKLYKTEQIKDIPFAVGKYHEDVFWSYQAVGRAARVSVFDTPCYFYWQRSGSIMGEGYSIKRLDAIEAEKRRLIYIKEKYPNLMAEAKCHLLFSCMYHMQSALVMLSHDNKVKVEICLSNVIREVKFTKRDLLTLPNKNKMWILLAQINFKRTCQLRNFIGVGV